MNPRTTGIITVAAIVGLIAITAFLAYEGLNSSGSAQIVGYQQTGDPRRIVIVVALGRLEDIAEREIKEDARSVTVNVHTRSQRGIAPSDLTFFPVTVSLQSGLGTRTVLDHNGTAVRYLGVFQLAGPTASP
ncbi:MAG: hypothetical protein M3R54_03040 [Chloroflexota bacterium]|nr:hypothetical protein [Chloroflexota bacterium]